MVLHEMKLPNGVLLRKPSPNNRELPYPRTNGAGGRLNESTIY